MGFINPLLLWGLAFLAVPIIIQFFVNRKKIVIHWAAYEWMKKAASIKRKKVKLNELLKLIAKLLLVLFVVLLLTRPTTRLSRSGNQLLIIDTSLSMATMFDGKSRLEHARALASEVIAKSDSALNIYAFDGRLIPLAKIKKGDAGSGGLGGLALSAGTGGPRDLMAALSEGNVLEKVDTIYLISDFQKSNYQDPAMVKEMMERLGKKKRLVFVPVDNRKGTRNISLESSTASSEGMFPGNENEVVVSVRNFSSDPAEGVAITLSIDGVKKDRVLVSLGPEEETTVPLTLALTNAAESEVLIEIPPDDYEPDNTLRMVVAPGEKLNVLGIVGPKGDLPFERDIFFVSALRAFLHEDFLNYERVGRNEVIGRNLDNFDVVISCGVPIEDNSPLANHLTPFLQKGGSLISFSDLSGNSWSGLGVKTSPVFTEMASVASEKLKGGYLSFMNDEELDPGLVKFFKFVTMPAASGGRLFVSGQAAPSVIYQKVGKGRMILVGFMPYPGFTNFYYNPNFVQFAMRLFWEAMNRPVVNAFTGREIEAIPVSPSLADGVSVFSLTSAAGMRRAVAMQNTADGDVIKGEPQSHGDFFTLTQGNQQVMKLGYNVSRDDSAIEPAGRGPFRKAEEDGLIFDEMHKLEYVRSQHEHLIVVLILMVLAVVFENYTHFWRRDKG